MKQTPRRIRRSGALAVLPLLGMALASSSALAQDTASQGERRPGSLGIRASATGEAGIGTGNPPANTTANGVVLDINRSLVITDPAILSAFPLQSVMEQIISTAKASSNGALTGFRTDGLGLWQQMWRHFLGTNPPAIAGETRCNVTAPGGFVRPPAPELQFDCPRTPEAGQASQDPFSPLSTDPNQFFPTALFNRVDLIDGAGAHCGEYRIIYARRNGGRSHVIFEATLPNPNPSLGLAGCRPVQAFWRDLSTVTNVAEQTRRLRRFYFEGLPGMRPVFSVLNFSDSTGGTGGRVRTNSFLQSPWNLHEFKYDCGTTATCAPKAVGVTVKDNPNFSLFDTATTPAAGSTKALFWDEIIANVPSLAINDVNRFHISKNTNAFNDSESNTGNGFGGTTEYLSRFGSGGTLKPRIQTALNNIQSTLTPENIITRFETQSCSGCHISATSTPVGGGLTFPADAGFVHVSEFPDATGRAQLSQALTTQFLPHRARTLAAFLNTASNIRVQRVSTPPAIDGNLNEASWTLTNNASKLVPVAGLANPTSDNDVVWGATWNDQFLFVGARVFDRNLHNDSGGLTTMHEDDTVEFYIDGNNERSTTFDGNDRQYVKRFNDSGIFEKLNRTTGVQHAWARINGGYSVEMAIPWTTIGTTPAANKVLGFDIGNNDDDNGGARDGQIIGTGNDNNFQSTANYDRIQLVSTIAPTTLVAGSSTVNFAVDGVPGERFYSLTNEAHERSHGPNELFPARMRFGAVRTPSALVLGATVKDATLVNDSVNPWDDDSVEFFLDMANNGTNPMDANDFQIIKQQGDTGISVLRNSAAVTLAGLTHSTKPIPGGYAVEISIPWTSLGLAGAPAAGTVIGFDAAFNDDNNGGTREGQAVVFSDLNNWTNASQYGDLRL